MEINLPFITPIAVFDMREFLPYIRSKFVDMAGDLRPVGPGLATSYKTFNTTLKGYDIIGEIKNQLADDEESRAFQKAAEANAQEFCAALAYESYYKTEMVSFWINEMKSGSFHEAHSHYGKNISGCFYADMPKNSPGIKFYAPKHRIDRPGINYAHYNQINCSSWVFTPEEGQLYLWESWMSHEVPEGNFEGVRRSAAVDFVLKRTDQ